MLQTLFVGLHLLAFHFGLFRHAELLPTDISLHCVQSELQYFHNTLMCVLSNVSQALLDTQSSSWYYLKQMSL